MVFKGEPNMLVRDMKKGKLYRFDSKGRIEIKDERTARRFAERFDVVRKKGEK
jgi:hypothetical protein